MVLIVAVRKVEDVVAIFSLDHQRSHFARFRAERMHDVIPKKDQTLTLVYTC